MASSPEVPRDMGNERDMRIIGLVDRAHSENWGGKHCSGFCEACADAYLVAQHAIPLAAALRLDDPERITLARLRSHHRWREIDSDTAEDHREQGWEVTTAHIGPVPPPASDPETVERVARAIRKCRVLSVGEPSDEDRMIARAVIRALNTTDDKEPQGG